MNADELVRQALAGRLRGLKSIDDPCLGSSSPAALEAGGALWPSAAWRRIDLVAVTEASGRRLEEYAFTPGENAGRLPAGVTVLPVAIMFEGDVARIYSAHELVRARGPILSVDAGVSPSGGPGDFLWTYFPRLESGDLEGALSMFEDDGYMRHSNGHRHQGPEELREDYVKMFGLNGGAIKVAFANVMDDGVRRVFECYMPNGRPAVAVYERGRSGRIAAIRISL